MNIAALHHASLIVSNLDRARFFYETILGLVPSPSRPPKSFDGVWYDIGPQQIHLIVAAESGQPSGMDDYGGMNRHIALTVHDLDALKHELERAGMAYTPSRSGRPVIFCRDPDGNVFELIGG